MPHQQVLTYPPAKRPSDCCSITFLRYALFSFITIFLLTGFALLGFGIWTTLEKSYLAPLLSPFFSISVYATIGIGVMVLAASVIGCHGGVQDRHCSMVIFTVLLALIFISEVTTGIISFLLYTSMTQSAFSKHMTSNGILNWNGEDAASSAIDNIQIKYKCCGAEYYTDWKENAVIQFLNTTTPDSCCISYGKGCGKIDHPSNLYRQGCAKYIENDVNLNIILLPAMNLGFSVIQVFGVAFSCAFARQVSRSRRFVQRRRYTYW